MAIHLGRAGYSLATLRERDFGLVWSSITLAGMSAQMEAVVLAWYVLTRTDSPFLVGLVASARMGLNFLALFAGAAADRLPRRLLLGAVQFVMAGLGLLMLVLVLGGFLEVWHIFAITVAGGLARVFQMPAAQSLAADSLPEDRIGSGVALTNVGMNLSLVAGPLIGGVLFDAFGPEGAYALIAVLYSLAGISALLVKTVTRAASSHRESVLTTVVQGLRYVKGQQLIWAALVGAVIINITGFPFHTTLMPIFARDVLDTGSVGLGLLMSAFGIGALIGSVAQASLPALQGSGKLVIAAIVGWHASMAVFAASTSLYLSLAVLVVTGMMYSWSLVLILTVLLRTALPEFRGRIMGLRVLAIYAHTFGSMGSGGMAGALGAPMAANINAVSGIAMVGLLALIAPKLRRA